MSAQLSGGGSIRHRQRGWVGMIIVLVALVIVALLAQTALKRYGLLSASAPVVGKPGDLPRASGISPAPLDSSAATPAPTAPMERARNVERTLQRDTEDLSRRIDEQTK